MTSKPFNIVRPTTDGLSSPAAESSLNAAIGGLRNELQSCTPAAADGSDMTGNRQLDQNTLDGILTTSAHLRSLADLLDTLVTDDSAPSPPMPEVMSVFSSQLERFSADLRTIREERNAARDALQNARLEVFQKLVAAAVLKDDDTGEHVTRMGHFCAAIARTAGAPNEYCKQLQVASRLHDIGKIGIPDAILKKQGALTENEWIVMRTHPKIGAALMGGTDDPLFQLAAEIALVHHEKYDGTGYPNRLQGENIPVSGRIAALADFFDAATMDRCYRPAMADEAVLALVRQGEGKHFDPAVVAAFYKGWEEIIDIRERIKDGHLC